eukprot:CAMPEP_0179297916 /NCGR_PEP_ID=MMETSP0797-20121207/45716_1 /TAXON_ID=47934 /ORGANISM="Dinophysis acuminata, Strain DAEP01" /LENGTH=76 /DNA_ID=CAMNT_0021007271 /DNA_START=66 /DNA_END=292 /DNA_ORIENTATION=+
MSKVQDSENLRVHARASGGAPSPSHGAHPNCTDPIQKKLLVVPLAPLTLAAAPAALPSKSPAPNPGPRPSARKAET